jgi:hypothetical protein
MGSIETLTKMTQSNVRFSAAFFILTAIVPSRFMLSVDMLSHITPSVLCRYGECHGALLCD